MSTPAETPTTTQEATPAPSGSNSGNRNNDGSGGGRGNSNRGYGSGRYRGARNQTSDRRTVMSAITAVQNATCMFEGSVPELGVIGLPIESNLQNVKLFETFIQFVVLYVIREWNNGAALKPLLERLIDPLPFVGTKPDDLTDEDKKKPSKVRVYEYEYKKWDAEREVCRKNMVKLFGLLLGQCTTALKSELKSNTEYEDKAMVCDSVWLLKEIKKVSSGVSAKKNEAQVYAKHARELFSTVQGPNETPDDFYKRLRARVVTLKMAGGGCIFTPDLKTVGQITKGEQIEHDIKMISAADDNEKEELKVKLKELKEKRMEEAVMAMIFMQQADRTRYGRHYTELDRSLDVGRDDFPENMTRAFEMLTQDEHRVLEYNSRRMQGGRPSYQFAQQGQGGGGNNGGGDSRPREMPEGTVLVPGRNGETIPWQCYNCNQWGHISRECPEPRCERVRQSVSMVQCVNSLTMSNVVDDFHLKKSTYLRPAPAKNRPISKTFFAKM